MRSAMMAIGAASLLTACTKEITVDLPTTEPKLVINGTIEPGQPPIVVVTRTESFFAPTDFASLLGIFVETATVTVDDGSGPVQLDPLSGFSIPDSILERAAQMIGIDPFAVQIADILIYTKTDGSIVGQVGSTYALNVQAEGKTVTGSSHMMPPEPLDTMWFKLAQQDPGDDTLGFIWQTTSDPPGLGNCYRWLAKRVNAGEDGDPKDNIFIAPQFAAFEDKYIDGLTFDWGINRGTAPFSTADDDENEERGHFKRGDTVVVKYVAFGQDEFEFYNSKDGNANSQGDLFSTPSNIKSNVSGGLGVWACWSPSYRTVVCQP
jgi:hypothetical protein